MISLKKAAIQAAQAARPVPHLPASAALPARRRPFSSTPVPCAKTIRANLIPRDLVPPYPYGDFQVFKQANRGLYGGVRKRFGNTVSPHDNKTRRAWKPNVHRKKLWSDALGAAVRVRLTTRALRTIRREGGIDGYVLGSKPARVKELGPGGWRLRWLVMHSQAVRDGFRAEREKLGVRPEFVTGVDDGEAADLVHVALDSACPGGLNKRSREIVAKRAREAAERESFIIGNRAEALGMLEEEDGDEEWEDEPIGQEGLEASEEDSEAIEAAEVDAAEGAVHAAEEEDMARRMSGQPSEKAKADS